MDKIEIKTVKLPHPTPLVIAVAGNNPPNPSTYIYFGQLNDSPPIIGIGIKKKRYTYKLIKEFGDWTINIVDKNILKEADKAGTVSGNKHDKSKIFDFTPSKKIKSFGIEKAIIIYEVQYLKELEFPDHNLVYGEVVNIMIDKNYTNENKIKFEKIPFILSSYYSMDYYGMGKFKNHWGFSLQGEK
jgi:flavin reductase (DIM6/NTAB) family NADH-FMN oxidoreductase RutF